MKYIVLKRFADKYTKEKYIVGQTIELTKKRAKEIEVNLGGGFIESAGDDREDG